MVELHMRDPRPTNLYLNPSFSVYNNHTLSMKPLLICFLLGLSALHAQWILEVGGIQNFYVDPELMKKNNVVSFLPVTTTHDKSLPKVLRLDSKWRSKEYYW